MLSLLKLWFSSFRYKRSYRSLAILFRPFGLLAPKYFKLCGFHSCRRWVYLMKVIPETRRPPETLEETI